MKNFKIIYLIILVLFISCKGINRNEKKYDTFIGDKFYYQFDTIKKENPWITGFKNEVFLECLKKGYKNDTIFKLMYKEDLFCYYENISLLDIEFAKKVGDKFSQNIKQSTYVYDNDEMNNKKYIMCTCLELYKSRDLDSVTKIAYKASIERK